MSKELKSCLKEKRTKTLIIISLKRQDKNIPLTKILVQKYSKNTEIYIRLKKKEKSERKGSTRKRDRGKMKRGKGEL